MSKFFATDKHYRMLRTAVNALHRRSRGLTSGRLLQEALDHYQSLMERGEIHKLPKLPTRSKLEHFRNRRQQTIRSEEAAPLWDYIKLRYPNQLKAYSIYGIKDIAYAMYGVFGFDAARLEALSNSMKGDYVLYHFSERFHELSEEIPQAVVIAHLHVSQAKDEVIIVHEKQTCDGEIGNVKAQETSEGFCLQEFRNIVIVMKTSNQSEFKCYVFDTIEFSDIPDSSKKIESMKGFMVQLVEKRGSFRSGVYATRLLDNPGMETNIKPLNKIEKHIVEILQRRTSSVVALRW